MALRPAHVAPSPASPHVDAQSKGAMLQKSLSRRSGDVNQAVSTATWLSCHLSFIACQAHGDTSRHISRTHPKIAELLSFRLHSQPCRHFVRAKASRSPAQKAFLCLEAAKKDADNLLNPLKTHSERHRME